MDLSFSVTEQEADLIVTALAELPMKAQPGGFRNQLIMKMQAQATEQAKAKESKPEKGIGDQQ